MVKIGMQASHEQFSPVDLLKWSQLAEKSGFDYVLSSDHISPWREKEILNSAFSWSWLGAAMQSTSLGFGAVSVPGYRYHPVILAHAVATLCCMYPGRFDPCFGSGEALNEHVVGKGWPNKAERNQILYESVGIMKKLWKGETVTHKGLVEADTAKLYILPPEAPTVYGAALTSETAEWVGSWADGLITIADDSLGERVEAFKKNGGEGKPMILKMDFSYATKYEDALNNAYDEWKYLLLPPEKLGTLKTPEEFAKESKSITKQMVAEKLTFIANPKEALEWLKPVLEMGFEKIILHNINQNQSQFIHDFGGEVLPRLNPH